jgi:tetratricopeptide (TPR) repeat protein
MQAEFDRAMTDIEAAVRLDPASKLGHNGRAWMLASCPVARIRNGREAVVSATRVCELTGWSDPNNLAILAAAYSETGDFAAAIRWQSQAVDKLDLGDSRVKDYAKLLKCYEAKNPYLSVGRWQDVGISKR